jgi:hypothetical protein
MSCLLLMPVPAALLAASDTPAIFLLCIAMTMGLLFYTFYFPLAAAAPEKDRRAFLLERKDVVYDNLRDLNFEYRAGKYPESDYRQMRAALEDEAAALLGEIDMLESGAAATGHPVIPPQRKRGPAGQPGKGARS